MGDGGLTDGQGRGRYGLSVIRGDDGGGRDGDGAGLCGASEVQWGGVSCVLVGPVLLHGVVGEVPVFLLNRVVDDALHAAPPATRRGGGGAVEAPAARAVHRRVRIRGEPTCPKKLDF